MREEGARGIGAREADGVRDVSGGSDRRRKLAEGDLETEGWTEVKYRRRAPSLRVFTDISRGKARSGQTEATSFFFTSFPEWMGAREMWEVFRGYGKVDEVIIPPRRDVKGKRFGFVRFFEISDKWGFAKVLNTITIGDMKLAVNVPRFQRKPLSGTLPLEGRGPLPPAQRVAASVNLGREEIGRSFAEVVKGGGSGSRPGSPIKEAPLSYHVEEDQVELLKKAFVAQVQSPGMTFNLQEEFARHGYFDIKVTPMGANLALLQAIGEEDLATSIEEIRGWLANWLLDIKPWDPALIDCERYVWVRIHGVPAHAWNVQFFSFLAKSMGEFINVDDNTRFKRSLDVARVLIRVHSFKAIQEQIKVCINGSLFVIRLSEEWFGPRQQALVSPAESGSSSGGADSGEEEEASMCSGQHDVEQLAEEAIGESRKCREEDGQKSAGTQGRDRSVEVTARPFTSPARFPVSEDVTFPAHVMQTAGSLSYQKLLQSFIPAQIQPHQLGLSIMDEPSGSVHPSKAGPGPVEDFEGPVNTLGRGIEGHNTRAGTEELQPEEDLQTSGAVKHAVGEGDFGQNGPNLKRQLSVILEDRLSEETGGNDAGSMEAVKEVEIVQDSQLQAQDEKSCNSTFSKYSENIWRKFEDTPSGKIWQLAKLVGVLGVEDDSVYEELIQLMDKRDQAVKASRSADKGDK